MKNHVIFYSNFWRHLWSGRFSI